MNNGMDGGTSARESGSHPEHGRERFNVLITYDNPVNARRAMQLVDGLAGQFGNDFEIHRDLWRFDMIELAGEEGDDLRDVTSPDLIIVAADGKRDLPSPVRSWLDTWAAEGVPGSAAIVALLGAQGPSSSHASPVRACLQALAAEAGMELFVREFNEPANEEINAAFASIHPRAAETSSVLRQILDRSQTPYRCPADDSRRNQGIP